MRVARTEELDAATLAAIKNLLETSFAEPFVEDWDHALGGVHFFIEVGGKPVSHASVVPRRLETGGRTFRTGYVEAAATRPDHQRQGLAAQIMTAVGAHIVATYHLGGLSSSQEGFYERFGWEVWNGPTFFRGASGLIRTPEEDGGVMILRTPHSSSIDLDAPISCEWRTGDVW